MNEAEKKILQNLENPRPITILKTYWRCLISKIQDCNEKLFIMDNISFFRESEKKLKNKKPIYSYALQEIILRANDALKNAAKTGKITIEGAEDPFYSPAIFKYQDANYFYFTDEMAADYSFYLLGSEIQFSDSIITHHYILSLKKIFHVMSETDSQRSGAVLWTLQNFNNLYHEIILRYEQTMRAERNGDRGRSREGTTKLNIDEIKGQLRPDMNDLQIRNLLIEKKPSLKTDHKTRDKYIRICKEIIETFPKQN